MISSIGSTASSWANSLFTKLDTKNQGYIEKSDLQAAFDKVAQSSGTSGSSTDVDNVFSQLDGDSDGKVTKSELTTALTKVANELNAQFDQSRVKAGMGGHGGPGGPGGMPPGPPPQGGAGSTGSTSSTSTSNDSQYIAAADTNGDGTVSAEEAAAYASTQAADSGTSAASSSSSSADNFGALMSAMGGMPPPPPPGMQGANDTGFSKDELSSQLQALGSTDSKRSELLSKLVANFDQADTNGDGKITGAEARTYDKSSKTDAAGSSSASSDETNALMRIVQLLRAYSAGDETSQANTSNRLSVTA